MTDELIEYVRWAVEGDFKTSPKQVLAYLQYKGYKFPLDRETRKPTSNNEGLENLILKHPEDKVLPKVVEARHLGKGIGYLYDTFVGQDGCYHALFTQIPKTGRLSSKAPNLMNLPQGRKGEVLARVSKAIRETLIPRDGYVLCSLDWKSIENLLVGYFAGDEDYMRVARLGVHSYMTAFKLKTPPDMALPDDKLKAFLDAIKENNPKDYAIMKKSNHAYNYDQGVRNMAKDVGCTVEEAKEYRAIIDKAAPKLVEWKHATRMRAHHECKLTTPFGWSLAFFEVFKFKTVGGERKTYLGKEAKEALSFLPQGTGAGMLKECLIDLGNHPDEGTIFNLLVPTHDSIGFEVLEEARDDVMGVVKESMEREWPQLNGLSCKVEGKYGDSFVEKDMVTWG
jgi:DNA polymerase I-like protein with 3'-5' exonuclease and polymerase domains